MLVHVQILTALSGDIEGEVRQSLRENVDTMIDSIRAEVAASSDAEAATAVEDALQVPFCLCLAFEIRYSQTDPVHQPPTWHNQKSLGSTAGCNLHPSYLCQSVSADSSLTYSIPGLKCRQSYHDTPHIVS